MVKLKNKSEREAFIKNYRLWGVWKEIPELNLKYYRYNFPNGTYIIVTEYTIPSTQYRVYLKEHYGVKYHLILSDTDEYANGYGQSYTYFEPNGCSLGTLIDYLTKNRHLEVRNE